MARNDIHWQPSHHHGSVSMELEPRGIRPLEGNQYQTIDLKVVDQICAGFNGDSSLVAEREFGAGMFEVKTASFWLSAEEIRDGVKSMFLKTWQVCRKLGIYPGFFGWASYVDMYSYTQIPDYQKLLKRYPFLLEAGQPSGIHCHFGVTKLADEEVGIIRRLNSVAPLILALFANSYHQKSGIHSYRYKLFSGLPGACWFEFDGKAAYENQIKAWMKSGVVMKPTRYWAWIRPAGKFSIENRIADQVFSVREAQAIVALCTALVSTLYVGTTLAQIKVFDWLTMNNNASLAAASGLSNPETLIWNPFESGKQTILDKALRQMMEFAESQMKRLGFTQEYDFIINMIERRDNGAMRVQQWLKEGKDPVREAIDYFREENGLNEN